MTGPEITVDGNEIEDHGPDRGSDAAKRNSEALDMLVREIQADSTASATEKRLAAALVALKESE